MKRKTCAHGKGPVLLCVSILLEIFGVNGLLPTKRDFHYHQRYLTSDGVNIYGTLFPGDQRNLRENNGKSYSLLPLTIKELRTLRKPAVSA
ncbi:hypothetical protein ACS5PU_10835 [Pedobacter sp. GSP4]